MDAMDEHDARRERTDAGAAAQDELISRLRIIESQPLAERAAAYTALHDELARRLDAGPSSGDHVPHAE
jgi:hypothetical protein